jgi:hypothetical protein
MAADVTRAAEEPHMAVRPHEHDPVRSHAVALADIAVYVHEIIGSGSFYVIAKAPARRRRKKKRA